MRDNDNRHSDFERRGSNTNTCSLPEHPNDWRPGAFGYERLDAHRVAREALVLGDRLVRRLPRGYSKLGDQLRRALLSTYLGIAEGASRTGADRLARFRCSRGEAAEAAAALEAIEVLRLAPTADVRAIVALLRRVAAMLTRLAKLSG